MQVLPGRLVSFTMFIGLVIVLFPPFTSSSDEEHTKSIGSDTVNNHNIQKMLSVLLATAGAVMSIKNFNNAFDNHHQRLGVALYGIIWLQALTGVLRPWRGCKGRSGWFFAHWLLGTAVCILGVISIYTGLGAYHEKTSRSTKLWAIAFTAEISVMVFIYLFQDKWVHIQKQGVILSHEPVRPTEEHISSTDEMKQKEPATENC
ncbi:hypothetical protein V6N13_131670 [Hibiscus sabdariffa]|uniref:Cytochrome b561 domain-containing protein n=2 Tax=Hibiscus sabdariffa TaxID=183260 RepID=A0ABR2D8L7_9ROSI